MEYIHEETYDALSNNKWTVFNKHAIQLEDESDHEEILSIEDKIINEMKMNDKSDNANISNIPESTWVTLYEAKC